MLDMFGIDYKGIKARPTYEELFNFVHYLVEFLDQTSTCTRDSTLLTQLDGIGMLEFVERNARIERHKDDMIRHIAANNRTVDA